MNRFGLLTVVVLASAIAAGCGGKQSVASKSAAAYREAVAKGIPVGAGAHGGHMNESAPTPAKNSDMAGMQHGSIAGMDHSKMQQGSMPGMDHSRMEHGSMAGMDHSKMKHGSMAGMDHAKMEHGSMAGMDHAKMEHGSMAGMSNMAGMHHATGAPSTPVVLGTPATSAGIARLNPSATLQQDDFDRPAPGGHR